MNLSTGALEVGGRILSQDPHPDSVIKVHALVPSLIKMHALVWLVLEHGNKLSPHP